jgi:hypothetical protein
LLYHHTIPTNTRNSPGTAHHINPRTLAEDRPNIRSCGLAILVITTSVTIGAVGLAPAPELGFEALRDDSAESPPVGFMPGIDLVVLLDVLELLDE